MDSQWITWGFQALLVLLVGRVWIQLDKNTDAINQLRVDLPTNYETKAEHDKDMGEIGERVHKLSGRLHVVELKEAAK